MSNLILNFLKADANTTNPPDHQEQATKPKEHVTTATSLVRDLFHESLLSITVGILHRVQAIHKTRLLTCGGGS